MMPRVLGNLIRLVSRLQILFYYVFKNWIILVKFLVLYLILGVEQEKEEKTEHQANKEWRRRDLISRIDRSIPSKHLLLLSHQRHHNTQCGTARHRSILRCLPNGPCQDVNKFATLWGITQITPKRLQTIDHSSKAMGQWRRRWFTDSSLLLHIKHQSMTGTPLFHSLSRVKILPKAAVQEKRATLAGIFELHTAFHGKRLSGVEKRDK